MGIYKENNYIKMQITHCLRRMKFSNSNLIISINCVCYLLYSMKIINLSSILKWFKIVSNKNVYGLESLLMQRKCMNLNVEIKLVIFLHLVAVNIWCITGNETFDVNRPYKYILCGTLDVKRPWTYSCTQTLMYMAMTFFQVWNFWCIKAMKLLM